MTFAKPYKRPVNTVFQSYALFPHLSVEDNVAFGLKRQKVGKDEIAERVDDLGKGEHVKLGFGEIPDEARWVLGGWIDRRLHV